MRLGFLGGLVSGAAVSGVALGALSVLTPVPGEAPPEATAVEVPAGSEFDQAREDTAAELPKLQDTQTPDAVPQVAAPEPDDLSPLETTDTAGLEAPEAGAAEGALRAPDTPDAGVGVVVQSDAPVLPNPQAMAPQAPGGEEALSISTEPAQPVLPEAEENSGAFVPEAAAQEEAGVAQPEAEAAMEEEPAAEPEAVADAVEPETTEPQSEETAATETQSDEDSTGSEIAVEAAETAPETETEVAAMAEEPAAEAPAAPEPEPETVTSEAPAEAEEPAVAERAAEPVPEAPPAEAEVAVPAAPVEVTPEGSTIGNLAEGVKTNRLPTAIDAPEPAQVEVAAEPEAPAEDNRPPIEKFAAKFENPEGKPLMAIVLIDDGSSPIGPAALADFPYPLSFAVDATLADAADKSAIYNAAGFEVLAMANLPENADARDAEVSMATYLDAVPEAVAVFEGTGRGLQGSREATEQLADILKDTGHGLVLFPSGLNTAEKLVAREGVPAGSVFRDFDGSGQSASAIRRFLDQAAFRAGQEEDGVIMVGRLQPNTISALLLWGLQDRAASVALAPISAVLKGE